MTILLAFVRENEIDRIVVAIPWSAHDRLNDLIRKLRTVPIRIDLCPHPTIWTFPQLSVSRLAGVPLINAANGRLDHGYLLVKRVEDLILASIILLLLAPVFFCVAIMIKLDSKGPVFFLQNRNGFNNKIFKIYKFRSMYCHQDNLVAQATRNDSRVTRLGKYLRKYSIDELPQLINVILGTMSLVGPRPHPIPHNIDYAARIDEYFARHNVKPGMTGWAQVHGFRGEIDDESKLYRRVEHDLHYVENWSVVLDIEILIMTAFCVWHQDTAY